jgi:hypothetical protein
MKIWPFLAFENLAFLKLLMAKFGLFYFLGPDNPALLHSCIKAKLNDKKIIECVKFWSKEVKKNYGTLW